ncbi:MAG TPA: FAD-dependent thymidylate synthase [Spirochaetota bacterium]|nr:FAD-dependent thymidylate synthase [Spirochaetota bacterium]HPR50025.1 FAD-dependent thymidylate synthase [Spirochaetota bacterium]
MKVLLAGYNVDADIIETLKEKADWDRDNVTPETLSAAYARISRDPRDISVLRQVSSAEVDGARKSNERIIFGFGHHSVAEHAIFNLDVIGLSRLAVEEVQRFRLASYTEKSQRYITLEGDYYTPDEFRGEPIEAEYEQTVAFQNKTYISLYEELKKHLFLKHQKKVETPLGARTVDGWAKEDARYVLSLATLSQFGMTVNARNLERMLRRFRNSTLPEIRSLADSIYSIVGNFTPSIIQFTEPTPYDTERPEEMKNLLVLHSGLLNKECRSDDEDVELLYFTPDADDMLCATILFQESCFSLSACLYSVKKMSREEKRDIIKTALSKREFYDNVDRFFESVDFTFQLNISASNYAQLKRHRMSTQVVQDYDTRTGYTIPESISEIGKEDLFVEAIRTSEELHEKLRVHFPDLKNYILTNAHRRRVMLKLNARELYHLVSLRDDEHAQWDIRKTAARMSALAREVAPLTTMMLCGKSDFDTFRERVFG